MDQNICEGPGGMEGKAKGPADKEEGGSDRESEANIYVLRYFRTI